MAGSAKGSRGTGGPNINSKLPDWTKTAKPKAMPTPGPRAVPVGPTPVGGGTIISTPGTSGGIITNAPPRSAMPTPSPKPIPKPVGPAAVGGGGIMSKPSAPKAKPVGPARTRKRKPISILSG